MKKPTIAIIHTIEASLHETYRNATKELEKVIASLPPEDELNLKGAKRTLASIQTDYANAINWAASITRSDCTEDD